MSFGVVLYKYICIFFSSKHYTFLITEMEFIETILMKPMVFRYMLMQTLSGRKVSVVLPVEKKFAQEMRTRNKLPIQFCLAPRRNTYFKNCSRGPWM